MLPDTEGGPIANIRLAIRHQLQKGLLSLLCIDRAQAESHGMPDVIVPMISKKDDVRGRSHAVNVRFVRELRPLLHGEYQVVLADGTELTSGRSYRAAIQAMFGLG